MRVSIARNGLVAAIVGLLALWAPSVAQGESRALLPPPGQLGITATANGTSVVVFGACALPRQVEGALPVGPGSNVELTLEWPADITDAQLVNADNSAATPLTLVQQSPTSWVITLPPSLPTQQALVYVNSRWARDGFHGEQSRTFAVTAPASIVSAHVSSRDATATVDLLAPARVEGVLTRRGAPQAASSRRTQRPRRRPRPTLPTVLGRATISATSPGSTAVKVPLSNPAKRALSAYRRVPVMLTLITTTADGSQTTLQRRLWIQRGTPVPSRR
jgi:hypothetical protein